MSSARFEYYVIQRKDTTNDIIFHISDYKNTHLILRTRIYIVHIPGSLELDVYCMSGEKDNWGRADRLQAWFREGGVLIIGYDMFRNLTNEKNKKFKSKQRNIFNQ